MGICETDARARKRPVDLALVLQVEQMEQQGMPPRRIMSVGLRQESLQVRQLKEE